MTIMLMLTMMRMRKRMTAMQMKLMATQWHPTTYSLQSVCELGRSQHAVDNDDIVYSNDYDDFDDIMMQIRSIKASFVRKVKNDNSDNDNDSDHNKNRQSHSTHHNASGNNNANDKDDNTSKNPRISLSVERASLHLQCSIHQPQSCILHLPPTILHPLSTILHPPCSILRQLARNP